MVVFVYGGFMENRLKDLRVETGLNRKEFAEVFEIPLRTVEDWEAGRRKMPDYLFRLMHMWFE